MVLPSVGPSAASPGLLKSPSRVPPAAALNELVHHHRSQPRNGRPERLIRRRGRGVVDPESGRGASIDWELRLTVHPGGLKAAVPPAHPLVSTVHRPGSPASTACRRRPDSAPWTLAMAPRVPHSSEKRPRGRNRAGETRATPTPSACRGDRIRTCDPLVPKHGRIPPRSPPASKLLLSLSRRRAPPTRPHHLDGPGRSAVWTQVLPKPGTPRRSSGSSSNRAGPDTAGGRTGRRGAPELQRRCEL